MELIELRSARPGWLLRLGKWIVSKRPSVFPTDRAGAEKFLHGRKIPQDAPIPNGFERRFSVERWQASGHDCVTLHPRDGKGKHHILYFHGGGFVLPMIDVHWPLVAALVDHTGASLTVPLYPVAPEATRQEQDAVADAAFARISAEWHASDVVLSGDSAGGHMALALALRQIRSGRPVAGRLVLFAPWLDISLADEQIRTVEPDDVMLKVDALRAIGIAWAGGDDPASAELSPLYAPEAELALLPPTQIFVGRHDIFVIDSRTFAARLREAGGEVRLFEYAAAPHVFMALTPTREAKDCFGLVSEFLSA